MRAMVLSMPDQPLQQQERPLPIPGPHQLLLKVLACGVCRTDLHLVDGELPQAVLPRVPGHEIVGEVTAVGSEVAPDCIGRRVGVPWLGWTCGQCAFCTSGRENLCDAAQFTGCHLGGGYAEYTLADQRFCFPIPEVLSDIQAAPLLCGQPGPRVFAGRPVQGRDRAHALTFDLTARMLPGTEYSARSVLLPINRSIPTRCTVPITTTSAR
jgi:propanol-preferring alcohol dehydrogenase